MLKISFVILTTSLLFGCSASKKEEPNLRSIYNYAASNHHDLVSNPVIVIPGLLGSNLKEPVSGRSVWGVFDNDYINLNRKENFPVVALRMQQDVRVSRIDPQLAPNGALNSLRFRSIGIPLQQRAYVGILKALGVGGFRDSHLATDLDWGKEHFTCFQFSYDWRLSNAQNARSLDLFIKEKKAYIRKRSRELYGKDRPNLKFDIVAHSMGGLVARYYLRHGDQELPADGSLPKLNWKGAENVNQLIMVATPNNGSTVVFEDMLKGKTFLPEWKRRLFAVSLPKFSPAILGTYPSLYEIFPRTRHQPLLNLADDKPLDLFDHDQWVRQSWGILDPSQEKTLAILLPEVSSAAERREIASQHVKKCLRNAEQFHRSLDRPGTPPKHLSISLIVGDATPTLRQVKIDLTNNKIIENDYSHGDGTVLRSSALADQRDTNNPKRSAQLESPIQFHRVTFFNKQHLEITQDPGFTDNILYQLLEEPR